MTLTNEDKKQIAVTILQQIGGNKFLAITGSKVQYFGTDKDTGNVYLMLKLRRNKARAQYLKITLDASDTYRMKFFSVDDELNHIVKWERDTIYDDGLAPVFEEVTGLYTSL